MKPDFACLKRPPGRLIAWVAVVCVAVWVVLLLRTATTHISDLDPVVERTVKAGRMP